MQKINTFIFLTPRSISSYEEEKWSLQFLKDEGFEVIVLNLEGIHDKKYKSSSTVANPIKGDSIHDINTFKQFENIIKLKSNQGIFVDYLICHSDLNLKWEKIFRLLKKNNAQYMIISSGLVPEHSNKLNKSYYGHHKLITIIRKLVKATLNPSLTLNYLATKLILLITAKRYIYPLPTLIFGGDSERLINYLNKRNINKEKIIPINCYDYDQSILYNRTATNFKLKKDDNLCIFLDEAATHHSDFLLSKTKPADQKIYFKQMNKLFDYIENIIGMRVVIAAHPRSKYESLGDVFLGREVIKGKTLELVSRCGLVLMHGSTSVSFAVIYKKRVITVKIPGTAKNYQGNFLVECFSNALGCNSIDLQKDTLNTSLFSQEINIEKYSEYLDSFIKTQRAADLPEWQIVVQTIRSINNSIT